MKINMIISFSALVLACACYAINQLWYQYRLRWSKPFGRGLFDGMSWLRKYAYTVDKKGSPSPAIAPNNWYYKIFKIKYKEKFPGSATIFVLFTDGMHFTQHFYIILLVISIMTSGTPGNFKEGTILFFEYYFVWLVFFNLFYSIFSKK